MPSFVQTITDPAASADIVRRRRYGVIEMADGKLTGIRFRPWPKLASLPEIRLVGRWQHARRGGDRCRLYFNQPLSAPNYLSLTYVVSNRDTTYATFRGAVCVLEQVAEIKRSDAILCDLGNPRISDRLLDRWGWEPLKQNRWHRQFIKRFYGDFSTRLKLSIS
ncbi:MAG: hypothetical protein MI757_04405 [Pirellulales bacterium]|nr:hypothetical protein [Pirellulales bacterium]